MNNDFKIHFEWLSRDSGSSEEKATFAELQTTGPCNQHFGDYIELSINKAGTIEGFAVTDKEIDELLGS
ncbi:MAG: hypothetical protein WA705_03050 [Candidatus Ozemobacteraceae bacterium]